MDLTEIIIYTRQDSYTFKERRKKSCLKLLIIIITDAKKYSNSGSGKSNNLSHTTYGELITIMADSVRREVVNPVSDTIYYSLFVDSTPDVAHVDQLTVILRYVSNEGIIHERFLSLIPIENHDAKSMEVTVVSFFDKLSFS